MSADVIYREPVPHLLGVTVACFLFFSFQVPLNAASKCEGLEAFKEKCLGEIRQTHSNPPYKFTTTTRRFWNDKANVHVYETCVENHSDKPLYINWLVPKQDGWIDAGCAWPKPRPKLKNHTLGTYDGCLKYGNLKHEGYGTILPHRDDSAAIEREGGECPPSPSSTKPLNKKETEKSSILDFFEWVTKTVVPTDPKEPEQTLIEIKAYTTLKVSTADKSFNHHMTYYVRPLRNSSGANPQDLILRPEFGPLRAKYEQDSRLKGDWFPLSDKGTFSVSLDLPENPILGEVGYVLSTREGRHLGTLSVPIWK